MTIVSPQEIEKALKYKNISDRLCEHLDESLGYFDYYQIVGIFLQGSQNYGLDTKESDIDTKLIVLPKFEDIVFNKQPVSTTHIRENDEHIDFKDLRLYIQTFRKQNINFLEILFTDFKIISNEYEKFWNVLIKNREAIARYNPYQAVKAMKGHAMEKYQKMEHPYPARKDVIEKFGYDPKQLSHLVRIEDYLERYIEGESYKNCLYPTNSSFIMDIKLGKYSLNEARIIAEQAKNHIELLEQIVMKKFENNPNKQVDEIFNEVQYQIMKTAILKELHNDEKALA